MDRLLGGLGASATGGIAYDTGGNTALTFTFGLGNGIGFSEFSGVGGQISTAPTVFSLSGGSADTTITAGAGPAGSVTESVMNGPNGPIYTGTAEGGEGIGASFSPGASYTFVIPLPIPGAAMRLVKCKVAKAVEKAENPYSYYYAIPHGNPFPG